MPADFYRTTYSNQPSDTRPSYPTVPQTGYYASGGSNPAAVYASGSYATAPQASSAAAAAYGSSSAYRPAYYSNVPYSGGPSALVSQPPSTRDGGGGYARRQVPLVAYHETLCGIPYATFIATLLAGLLYITCVILILTYELCPFDREVSYLLVMLCVGIISICLMAGINILYPRYKYNFLSLTVSLIYSGSIALIAYGLYTTCQNGICPDIPEKQKNHDELKRSPDDAPDRDHDRDQGKKPLFDSHEAINYVVWFSTLLGLMFQILAHYFYG